MLVDTARAALCYYAAGEEWFARPARRRLLRSPHFSSIVSVLSTETVIVGAGPAGLAAAACLGRAGRPYVALERGEHVGESWHRHYERLHLHTVKETSYLPFRPFPAHSPRYVPRARVVEYLEDYRREMAIEPRLGAAAEAVEPADGRWLTRLADGTLLASDHVVVATGLNRVPVRPTWEGMESFAGTVEHSRDYRSGAAHRDRDVLVVGMGNTGAEIALDLLEQGARPTIAVRGPVNIVPRDFLGRPTQLTAIALARLPDRIGDAIGTLVRRVTVGDLRRWGIETPREPPAAQLRRLGKTPVIDVGTLAAIKSGRIRVRPGITRFDGEHVEHTDGRRERYDHVVLATGYRSRIGDFVRDAAPLLDAQGDPAVVSADGRHRGLHFVGFGGHSVGGLLMSIRRDALRVAATIAGRPVA